MEISRDRAWGTPVGFQRLAPGKRHIQTIMRSPCTDAVVDLAQSNDPFAAGDRRAERWVRSPCTPIENASTGEGWSNDDSFRRTKARPIKSVSRPDPHPNRDRRFTPSIGRFLCGQIPPRPAPAATPSVADTDFGHSTVSAGLRPKWVDHPRSELAPAKRLAATETGLTHRE